MDLRNDILDEIATHITGLLMDRRDIYVPQRLLDQLPAPEKVKWYCIVPTCTHHTNALYWEGMGPLYYVPGAHSCWYDKFCAWYRCGKHSKILKRNPELMKHYYELGTDKRFVHENNT